MFRIIKSAIKAIVTRTPYALRKRTSLNRFQAVDGALESLAKRGFLPDCVIDGGANIGTFSEEMLNLFPEAKVIAIEPQPGCEPALKNLVATYGSRLRIHSVALCDVARENRTLTLASNESATATGTHITDSTNELEHSINVPCLTLDRVTKDLRTPGSSGWLLKLDLQGFELIALQGAKETLRFTDIIVTEVSFYAQAYEPPISSLVTFLSDAGFELYDIGSVYARPRDNRPTQGDFVFVKKGSGMDTDRAWS